MLISLALVAGADFASKVGLVRPRGQGKRLAGGFLLGLISLALVAGTSFACHARVLSTKLSGGEIAHKLLGAAATAILVAVLEEILFRGALFGALRKAFNWIFALVVSSFVYALLHYFKSADITGPVTWTSGLRLLPLMFQNLANFHAMVPGFFNLTLAGILLSWAYHRTGNLYFSIGLHAGWIFWIKAYAIVSGPAPQANLWLWGSGSMAIVNGWIAVPVLLLTLLVFVNLIPRKA